MSFYLDASVLVPLFVAEPRTGTIASWVGGIEDPIAVADLAVSEFGSVISRLVRENQLDAGRAAEINAAFDAWRSESTEPVENLPADIRLAGKFVRTPSPKLLSPDAIHLATCRRLCLTLVTDDRDLLQIAAREQVDAISPS